ncbi:2-dehydropantoate 2-reductase [Endozoicomonas ascidiicola]|uniref:2-dehydropantoate 2-reductase n=1 Tax=Endozoicomonas ascidiicola TaxID=1698521 RepID=UPI00082A7CD0|nr:2-dehydropantoate 2-reductase [Endozoicomonas ascidiicola]
MNALPQEKWYILGAGSIGCLWAASLCRKGLPVTLILREHRLKSKQHQQALTLSAEGEIHHFQIHTTTPAHLNHPISRLIVCTKAQDALPALESLRPHLANTCNILLLQNGMGSQQAIAETFPDHTIWAGSSTDGAYLEAPFHVVHAGKGRNWIGPMTTSPPGTFDELLNNFPLAVETCEHIEEKLWQKLAINCCINGLTALFNCRNGELLDGAERQQQLEHLIEETALILQQSGMENPHLKEQVFNVCHATANNISSTCQDARLGRKTELPFINGFLINRASALNLPLPAHQSLLQQLREKNIE